VDPAALARRIAANALFRDRALTDPHQLLRDWRLGSEGVQAAAEVFASMPVDDDVRRTGHAALFSLLAATPPAVDEPPDGISA
jgi:hypothetical protein